MVKKQELHCHECNKYVQFEIDTGLEGNHVLICPVCEHEHCRVVRAGIVTDKRWGSRNGNMQTFYISTNTITSTSISTFDNYFNTSSTNSTNDDIVNNFAYDSWMNTYYGKT